MIIKASWHVFLMNIADMWATRSKDPSTKVGCVIAQGKFPVSSGYNGFPPGMEDSKEHLNNRELKLEDTLHAEDNAIGNGRKEDLIGATLYVTAPPCGQCASKIMRAKITTVFYKRASDDFMSRYKDKCERAIAKMRAAGIYVFEMKPLEKGPAEPSRDAFEGWAKDQPWFGYMDGKELGQFDRDGDGYIDGSVHSAWLGYRLRNL